MATKPPSTALNRILEIAVAARKGRGWSQADLAKRLGTYQATVSQLESGAVAPRVTLLLDVLHALDLELVALPAREAWMLDHREKRTEPSKYETVTEEAELE